MQVASALLFWLFSVLVSPRRNLWRSRFAQKVAICVSGNVRYCSALMALVLCAVDCPVLIADSSGTVTVVSLPSTLHYDLGTLQVGTTTERRIEIVNESLTAFEIAKVVSDCGCVVGVLEDSRIEPGSKSHILLKIRPSRSAKEYKRRITLISKDRSKYVELLLTSNAISLVSVSRDTIELNARALEPIEIDLTANFDGSLRGMVLKPPQDSRFDWQLSESTATNARIRLTAKTHEIPKADFGSVSEEWYSVCLKDGRSIKCKLQVMLPEPVMIRPATASVTSASETSLRIKLFVTGDITKALEVGKPSLSVRLPRTHIVVWPTVISMPKVLTLVVDLPANSVQHDSLEEGELWLKSAKGVDEKVGDFKISTK